MNDFEKALFADRGIPLAAASSYMLELRQFPQGAMSKTAGLTDPPDEEGALEGQFEVPVENVAALIANVLNKAFAVANATLIYEGTLRGPAAETVRHALSCSDYEYRHVIEYLTERATILAGPVHVQDIEPPPPLSDPVNIAKSVIRGNQELIHALGELKCVLGCNPMKDRVSSMMVSAQERADRMWRAIDGELPTPMPKDPVRLAKHEESESPEQEALESPELEAAEQAAGVEPPEHEAGEEPAAEAAGAPMEEEEPEKPKPPKGEKTASVIYRMVKFAKDGSDKGLLGKVRVPGTRATLATPGLALRNFSEDLGSSLYGDSVKKTTAAMAKTAKEETDAELKEKGRQRAVANTASEHAREQSRRGERAGKVLGALGGIAAGGKMGKKFVGGKAGTLGGAAIGGLVGRSLGGELGTEVDIARGKTASAAERMVAWVVKTAQEPGLGAGAPEAPMAAPTDAEELAPTNYLQAELLGQQAQENNESNYHKQRAQQAEAMAAQVSQEAQEQVAQLSQQAAQLQAEADGAAAKVQNALGQAVQARDEALEQTEIAANMRMAMQQHRQQLLELASQDPAANAAAALQQSTGAANPAVAPPSEQPPPGAGAPLPGGNETAEEVQEAQRAQGEAAQQTAQAEEKVTNEAAKTGAAQVPDAGWYPDAPKRGAAGGSPDLRTAPGSAPVGGGPDMNAPAGKPPGPPSSTAAPAGGVPPVTTKQANAAIGGALGAGVGALAGLGSVAADRGANVDALRTRLSDLQQSQDGSYGQAAAAARLQKRIIDTELAQQFPGQVAARRAAGTALSAGLQGAGIGASIQGLRS